MRDFLNAIFTVIESESLTDEEFDTLDPDLPETYTNDVYQALRVVLEGRENVSSQVKRLKLYFIARGADLTSSSPVPTPNSNIFIGSVL